MITSIMDCACVSYLLFVFCMYTVNEFCAILLSRFVLGFAASSLPRPRRNCLVYITMYQGRLHWGSGRKLSPVWLGGREFHLQGGDFPRYMGHTHKINY